MFYAKCVLSCHFWMLAPHGRNARCVQSPRATFEKIVVRATPALVTQTFFFWNIADCLKGKKTRKVTILENGWGEFWSEGTKSGGITGSMQVLRHTLFRQESWSSWADKARLRGKNYQSMCLNINHKKLFIETRKVELMKESKCLQIKHEGVYSINGR